MIQEFETRKRTEAEVLGALNEWLRSRGVRPMSAPPGRWFSGPGRHFCAGHEIQFFRTGTGGFGVKVLRKETPAELAAKARRGGALSGSDLARLAKSPEGLGILGGFRW